MHGVFRRKLHFNSPHEKARWLGSQARLDALLKPVRLLAAIFLRPSAMLRVDGIFRYVRDHIAYIRDPNGEEQLADAAVVLSRGFDDCDGKARLFAALIHATEQMDPLGVEVELVPVFIPDDVFSHVTAQVRWPKSRLYPSANAEGWIRAETILKGLPLGSGSEKAARDERGRLIFS